jgi:hypothetical protein
MKPKFKLLIASLVTAVLAVPVSQPSTALTFDFSFTNDPTIGNVSGTVTGEIVGLTDNATSAATAVYIYSIPAPLSLPDVPFNILSPPADFTTNETTFQNTFTVSQGQIISAEFLAVAGPRYSTGSCGCPHSYVLGLDAPPYTYSYFQDLQTDINGVTPNRAVDAFTVTFTPVSSVPAPNVGAGLPGLLCAIGLFAWWRRHSPRPRCAARE